MWDLSLPPCSSAERISKMEKATKIVKWGISAVGGFFATLTEQYGAVLILVCAVIVFDIITGLIKSKANGIKISSKVGLKGFWKKIALLLALFFGIFLDVAIPSVLSVVAVELPFNCPFGLIIGVYIILNESISILENFYAINPDIVPQWVKKIFMKAKNDINKAEIESEDKDEDTRI